MYKQTAYKSIVRISDNAYIPFDKANIDYEKFKSDVISGAELQDVDGIPMSSEDAIAYVKTLP